MRIADVLVRLFGAGLSSVRRRLLDLLIMSWIAVGISRYVVLLIIPSLDESSNRASSGGLIIEARKILLNLSLIDSSSLTGKSRSRDALISCNSEKLSSIHCFQV